MYLLKQEVLSLSVQREIHRILVDTGYTEADYEKDMENAKELEQTSYPVFNMALYVTLDGERVDVRVPMGEIREFNGGTLLNLTVLKTFASPEMGETGRFLLPDGTGSLMNFYNGKESQQEFSVPVYGRDLSVRQDEKIYKENVAYLPLFAKIIRMIVSNNCHIRSHVPQIRYCIRICPEGKGLSLCRCSPVCIWKFIVYHSNIRLPQNTDEIF